jgi:hypothetical protein
VLGRNVSNTGVVSPSHVGLASGGEIHGVMWSMVDRYDAPTNTLIARCALTDRSNSGPESPPRRCSARDRSIELAT